MFTVAYIAIIVFALAVLLFVTKQKIEVFALLLYYGMGVTMFYIIDEYNYNHYYVLMCAASIAVGYIVSYEFKVAAICAYLLVPTNILGYLLWYKHYPPDLYALFAAIILIIQFISILPKALFNGLGRTANGYSMDVGHGFGGNEECVTIHKRPTKEEARCAKR